MPASSQASSELSTASLTAVRRAFLGLSKPSRCLFFAKNSLTDMSRCFAAIDSAVTAPRFGCLPVSLTFGIFSVCFHFVVSPWPVGQPLVERLFTRSKHDQTRKDSGCGV